MSKFNTKHNKIFLDKDSPTFDINEVVDIVLSPSLYWIKKVILPVKYLRDVTALLPSLFEDVLPAGVYSYSAYKEDEAFYIFAYEDKVLIDLLATKGISLSQVRDVHFAQKEFLSIKEPISINDTQCLFFKDDVLVILPKSWFNLSVDLNLESINLSKFYISIKQFSHVISEKSLYTFVTIFVLFLLLIGGQYFILNNKISDVESMKDKVFQKYNLKSTMFQNRALLSEYEEKHHFQMQVRNNINAILDLHLKNKEKLVFMGLNRKKMTVKLQGITKVIRKKIEYDLHTKKISFKSKLNKDKLELEFSL